MPVHTAQQIAEYVLDYLFDRGDLALCGQPPDDGSRLVLLKCNAYRHLLTKFGVAVEDRPIGTGNQSPVAGGSPGGVASAPQAASPADAPNVGTTATGGCASPTPRPSEPSAVPDGSDLALVPDDVLVAAQSYLDSPNPGQALLDSLKTLETVNDALTLYLEANMGLSTTTAVPHMLARLEKAEGFCRRVAEAWTHKPDYSPSEQFSRLATLAVLIAAAYPAVPRPQQDGKGETP